MTSTTRLRFGAIAAAAAVVAGGFFAAAPANAATGTITLANTTYTAGSWGTGLDVTGAGFTAASAVTISIALTDSTVIETHDVTADASGAFAEKFTPAAALALPPAGESVVVTATSDAGDTSNTVGLTVLAKKEITTSVKTITTADLADQKVGFDLYAAGYTPGETLTVVATFNGETIDSFTETAEADGSLDIHLWMTGLVEAGTLTLTVTGGSSDVSQSASLTVTGKTVVTGGGTAPGVGTAAAPAATPKAPRLPVVSG